MKTIKKLVFSMLVIVSLALVMKNSSSKIDLAEIARAQDEAEEAETHYEIEMKLVWDKLYNLDLHVEEPSGDTASVTNTTTAGGGELGYYDSEGEWTYGDSGNNTAAEVYRVQYGLAGIYDISVFCNEYSWESEDEEEEEEETATSAATPLPILAANVDLAGMVRANTTYYADVAVNAYIVVTLYGGSERETYLRFPEAGTIEVASDENDGWWNASSFNFVPLAEKPYGWKIEDQTRCFIATAAYGSVPADEVRVLCLFRDRYMNNKPGRLVLKLYCKVSPYMAKFIQKRDFLKLLVRIHLNPVIKVVKSLVH